MDDDTAAGQFTTYFAANDESPISDYCKATC